MKMKMLLALLLSLSFQAHASSKCDDSPTYQNEHVSGQWIDATGHMIRLEFNAENLKTLSLTSQIKLSGTERQLKYLDGWYKSGREGDGAAVQVACTDPDKLYVRYYFQSLGGGDMRFHDYILEFSRLD